MCSSGVWFFYHINYIIELKARLYNCLFSFFFFKQIFICMNGLGLLLTFFYKIATCTMICIKLLLLLTKNSGNFWSCLLWRSKRGRRDLSVLIKKNPQTKSIKQKSQTQNGNIGYTYKKSVYHVLFCCSPVAASVTTTVAEMSEVFSDNLPKSVLFNFTSTHP